MPLTLEDREEIREVIARYDFAIDLGEPEAYANCFTQDGAFLHTGAGNKSKMAKKYTGRKELHDFCQSVFEFAEGSCAIGTMACSFSRATERRRPCARSLSDSLAASIRCQKSSRPESITTNSARWTASGTSKSAISVATHNRSIADAPGTRKNSPTISAELLSLNDHAGRSLRHLSNNGNHTPKIGRPERRGKARLRRDFRPSVEAATAKA